MRLVAPAGTVEPGQQVGIILKLGGQLVEITGRVVWTRDEDEKSTCHVGLMLEDDAPPELRAYVASLSGAGVPSTPRAAIPKRAPATTPRCPACRSEVRVREGETELWWCESCGVTWGYTV